MRAHLAFPYSQWRTAVIKLFAVVHLCCALGGPAFAQIQAPPGGPGPAMQQSAPDARDLPPDLRYEGRSGQSDPSAFPGEPDNKGYGNGAPENPQE